MHGAPHTMFASKTYGTVNEMVGRNKTSNTKRRSALSLVGCIAWSCLIYAANMVIAFTIPPQSYSILILIANIVFLVFTLGFAWPSITTRGNWIFFVFNSLIGITAGYFVASLLYKDFFNPYYDIKNLNVYPSVEPNLYRGSQLMDAGEIEFVPGSHLQINMSYGFKNDDVYCVAPIVSKTGAMDHYDFWAVGINCCSGHLPDFHCGEYANPEARKGLRLMRDDLRGYFRLAVEEATAAFNIKAPAPTFYYWMEYPSDEVHSYYADGMKYLEDSCVYYLIFQLTLIVLLMMCENIAKPDYSMEGGMTDMAHAL